MELFHCVIKLRNLYTFLVNVRLFRHLDAQPYGMFLLQHMQTIKKLAENLQYL